MFRYIDSWQDCLIHFGKKLIFSWLFELNEKRFYNQRETLILNVFLLFIYFPVSGYSFGAIIIIRIIKQTIFSDDEL